VKGFVQKIQEIDNQQLLIQYSDGTGDIFDETLKLINRFDSRNIIKAHANYLIYAEGGLFDRKFGVFDFHKEEKIFETESFFSDFLFENLSYSSYDGLIYCRNIETGKVKWKLSLERYELHYISEEARDLNVSKYIGVYNEILYIKLGKELIIGLAINNGDEKFIYLYKKESLVLENLFLDTKNGSIFSLGPTAYIEIDLGNGREEFIDLTLQTEEHKVQTTNIGAWENNRIFFWEGGSNNRFGVFDRDLKKIISSWKLTESENLMPAIRGLSLSMNKVYILDHVNTLNVFEYQ
jgi:hypothetical protein